MAKNKKQTSKKEKKLIFIVESLSGEDADYGVIEEFIENVLMDIDTAPDEIIEFVYDCCGGNTYELVEDD